MNYEEKLVGLIEWNKKQLANSPDPNKDTALQLKVRKWEEELGALRAARGER